MTCIIGKGRLLTSCKDNVGGLKNVYFINTTADAGAIGVGYIDRTAIQPPIVNNEAPGAITSLTGVVPTGLLQAYKYQLHMGNDLTQNVMSSAENGTTYVEQVLSLTLKKLTAEDNYNLMEIIHSKPVVIVEDNNGDMWIAGTIYGVEASAGTAVTGNDFGDMNGYTITLTGKERAFANAYTYADFEADCTVIN